MSGSNGRCSTSEREGTPLPYPDGPVEEDGFITLIATGWTRPCAGATGPGTGPEPPAPSELA